ncbi:hypothetical protein ACH5RR_024197 [Cinchona calisaya]|uniref:Uncharacterized protein n=1 Tax=Cinchona calisaya TaxID=153742 RepID=A0ABD2ZCT6_9GENT
MPDSTEFISALAAGMFSQLMVEITPEVSPSTVALAAAARQTGGIVICIIPELKQMNESHRLIQDSGLHDMVEFRIGDPVEVLTNYENIDFSLVDCKSSDHDYSKLLEHMDVNPRRSVVVVVNLVEGSCKGGLEGHLIRGVENEAKVMRSIKHPMGKGMEILVIGKSIDSNINKREKNNQRSSHSRAEKKGGIVKKTDNESKWIVKFDEESGEEHIYRFHSKMRGGF